eukprot:7106988-Lingulodinium_polyedra.AAC.1
MTTRRRKRTGAERRPPRTRATANKRRPGQTNATYIADPHIEQNSGRNKRSLARPRAAHAQRAAREQRDHANMFHGAET